MVVIRWAQSAELRRQDLCAWPLARRLGVTAAAEAVKVLMTATLYVILLLRRPYILFLSRSAHPLRRACCNATVAGTRLLNSCITSVLLYGLGRVGHGSWGQIGVQQAALRVLYIKGFFIHTSLNWCIRLYLSLCRYLLLNS